MCRVKIAENQAARAALKAERDRCREVEADLAAQVEQIESERVCLFCSSCLLLRRFRYSVGG